MLRSLKLSLFWIGALSLSKMALAEQEQRANLRRSLESSDPLAKYNIPSYGRGSPTFDSEPVPESTPSPTTSEPEPTPSPTVPVRVPQPTPLPTVPVRVPVPTPSPTVPEPTPRPTEAAPEPGPEPSLVPEAVGLPPASYVCEFMDAWTAARHPVDYPDTAHWSPPFIVAHSTILHSWRKGTLATDGAQDVAETGSTEEIVEEAEDGGFAEIEVGEVEFGSRQTLDPIECTEDSPYLTTMTMMAPSPDWFTGFSGYDMRTTDGSAWQEKVTIDTPPYDSGTDSGLTYTSPDNPTVPPVSIFELTVNTVPGDVLKNPSKTGVNFVARWECILQ